MSENSDNGALDNSLKKSTSKVLKDNKEEIKSLKDIIIEKD